MEDSLYWVWDQVGVPSSGKMIVANSPEHAHRQFFEDVGIGVECYSFVCLVGREFTGYTSVIERSETVRVGLLPEDPEELDE